MAFKALTINVLSVLFFLCSPNRASLNLTEETPPPGMKKIAAMGMNFNQGAHDSLASNDEWPVMNSGFTYDYWLDSTEVTQGEYAAVTGGLPVRVDTSLYGHGAQYPMNYVSWFDAVLFCNAKSERELLDTVYSFDGAPLKQNGSAYSLMNVVIHYDRNGYRLPTEAEWEFAAREGTSAIPFPHLKDSAEAVGYAWYAVNSGDMTHPVAMLRPNKFSLYDMAGNVYEWTNDWRGCYQSAAIVNSLGTPFSNGVSERVVKGGSFEHGFSSLRPSRRATTYPSTQSTATEHIGFRCARGKLLNGRYIGVSASSIMTNAVQLIENNIGSFLGTHDARLVFVNTNTTGNVHTLCFIDFWSSYPGVYEFKDCTDVFKPVISPNGRNVAFCSANDGQRGFASITVRSLDSVTAPATALPCDSAFGPRWWVDPASQDTFILYSSSAEDNASATWGTSKTYCQKMRGRSPWGFPMEITDNGGYHDGRTRDGRYLTTGFTRLLVDDLSNNRYQVMFQSPYNGKETGASSQACNVSVSPDTGNLGDRCLFLDFGAPAGSALTGRPYGIHEYLFIEDFSHGDSIASWLHCPDGEAAWNYPEWSNVGRFAAASAENAAGNAHVIYCVDFNNNLTRKVVEGENLMQPFLWVREDGLQASEEGLDIDSLGNYNDPPVYMIQQYFMYRFKGFWRKHRMMEIVFLGSSHTAQGIDPRFISGDSLVYNISFGQGNFLAERRIILDYLLNQCPSLKLIGMDMVVGWMFYRDGNVQNDWYYIADSKGYIYDKNHGFWADGLPENFERLIDLPICPIISSNWDTLGLDNEACIGWGGAQPDIGPYTSDWTVDQPFYRANIDSLMSLVKVLSGRNIHLLLYLTPESPYYRNTDAYGRWGPDRANGAAAVAQLKALQDTFPKYYHFYDANLEGYHDYADSEAWDFDHLCVKGAEKLSKRVGLLVDSILYR